MAVKGLSVLVIMLLACKLFETLAFCLWDQEGGEDSNKPRKLAPCFQTEYMKSAKISMT